MLIAEKQTIQSLLLCVYNATIDAIYTTTATIDTTTNIIVTYAAAATGTF